VAEIQNFSENETLDDLILGGMKLIQPKHGYRFSLDAVLLAHFAELSGVKRVIDLGTGSGVIPLLLAARAKEITISGIEIQPALVDRAWRSICLNGLDDRIKVIQADIREIDKIFPDQSTDLVLSNPPFFKKNEGIISSNMEGAVARHELKLVLEDIVSQGAYLLVSGGRMAIIHRAERLEEILELYKKHKIYPRRLRLVHSFKERNAALLLLEGRKNTPGKLTILPPLVIYNDQGEYCEEIKSIYSRGN
jgi:tRNA1Val (adenine37-N6)-methyltransferase